MLNDPQPRRRPHTKIIIIIIFSNTNHRAQRIAHSKWHKCIYPVTRTHSSKHLAPTSHSSINILILLCLWSVLWKFQFLLQNFMGFWLDFSVCLMHFLILLNYMHILCAMPKYRICVIDVVKIVNVSYHSISLSFYFRIFVCDVMGLCHRFVYFYWINIPFQPANYSKWRHLTIEFIIHRISPY